jgi:hypothetical protein
MKQLMILTIAVIMFTTCTKEQPKPAPSIIGQWQMNSIDDDYFGHTEGCTLIVEFSNETDYAFIDGETGCRNEGNYTLDTETGELTLVFRDDLNVVAHLRVQVITSTNMILTGKYQADNSEQSFTYYYTRIEQ